MKTFVPGLLLLAALAPPISSRAYVRESEFAGTRTNDCRQSGQGSEVLASGLPFASQFAPLGRGVAVRGRIETTGTAVLEADCFSIHASDDERITAHVVDLSGGSSDPALEVWESTSPTPSLRLESDDDGPKLWPALAYTATSTRSWDIRIRGSSPADDFEYLLVLSTSGSDDAAIREGTAYNDTQAAAELLADTQDESLNLAALAPGHVAVKVGALASATDVDVYRTVLPNAKWVSGAIYDEFGGLHEDLALTIVANGSPYADDDSGPFAQPQVKTGRASGTAYFEVRHAPRQAELDWVGMRGSAGYRLVVSFMPAPATSCGMFGIEPLLLLVPWLWRRRKHRAVATIVRTLSACIVTVVAPPSHAEPYDGALWNELIDAGFAFEKPSGSLCVAPLWSPAAQIVREYGISETCKPRWEQRDGRPLELVGQVTLLRGDPDLAVLEVVAPTSQTWTSAMMSEYNVDGWAWTDRLDWLNEPTQMPLRHLLAPIRTRASQELGAIGYAVVLPDGPEKSDVSSCSAPLRRFPVRVRFILQ